MPDETQTGQRRTAMQVAEAAQALAEGARTEADNAVGLIEGLSEKVTDLSQRVLDATDWSHLPDAIEQLGNRVGRLEAVPHVTRDQVDSRIDEATRLINEHLDVVQKMAAPRTALDALKEETGGFMGAVNRKLDDMRRTADRVLESASGDRPAQEVIDGLLARIEALESRPVSDASNPGLTWDAIAERVTNQAKIEVQKHLALIAPAGTGAGPAKPRGVQAKVLKLMRNVDAIGKDRQAEKSAGGYRFRGIDEAMDAVGHAMRDIGLIGSPQVRSIEYDTNYSNNSQGRSILWTTARVVGAYVFTDPEDGSTHRIELVGEGRDNSDKATSKASSMALKYGLLHGLMIPVNGMPDGDRENPEVSREREQTANPNATQQAPPPEAPPAAPKMPPQERAQRAVAAFQGLHQVEGQERYNRFVAMNNYARKEGLIDLEVEWKDQRAPLHYFVSAVELLLWPKGDRATVEHQRQNPHTDVPPADEPPPWDGN